MKILSKDKDYKNKDDSAIYTKIKYDYDAGDVVVADKTDLRNILLLSNIYPNIPKNTNTDDGKKEDRDLYQKFPFKIFNNTSWDIEHISPKTINTNISKIKDEDFNDYITSLKSELELHREENMDSISKIENYLGNKQNKSDCISIWKNYTEKYNEDNKERINDISNLVLLNSSINREYGNAFFHKKRETIIEKDKNGEFIPPTTKRAFFKYYSKQVLNNDGWKIKDADSYGAEIVKMLREVYKW